MILQQRKRSALQPAERHGRHELPLGQQEASTSGIVATTLPAISSDHCVRRVPWKFASPSWRVSGPRC